MVVSRFPRSSEISAINESLSWNTKEQGVVIVRVDGVIKLLECSPDYFREIESAVDGTRTGKPIMSCCRRLFEVPVKLRCRDRGRHTGNSFWVNSH